MVLSIERGFGMDRPTFFQEFNSAILGTTYS